MTGSLAQLTVALADRYRIERELGQGGMATVYLAQDLKHDRKVAIKVLRPELAAVIGAERFLREIKTIAHLQHPHILGLIDSGEVNGTAYYVMPYVEGESLRDRLSREKQLPIPDAIRFASEVAAALDYAHRHGVIHRDIKPENVMLHDGSALVTDFGIALAVSSAGGSRMTETGMSLGTPQYMSPEQAMGEREITARSDVYALGAMTYEMLVGETPFTGPTAQSIVAKVVTEQPRELIPQRHTIPPHVNAAVLTALEKLPADRFATAAQFAEALAHPGVIPLRETTLTKGEPAGINRFLRSNLVLMIGALLLALAGVLAGMALATKHEPAGVMALSLLPSGHQLSGADGRNLALSPDEQTIAYIARGPSGRQIYLRRLDSYEARPIPGTENVFLHPLFSPDGRSIAYVASGGAGVYRVGLWGGQPVRVATDAACCTLEWNDAGIYTITGRGLTLWPISSSGQPRLLAELGYPGIAEVLPGGEAVLNLTDIGGRHVEVVDVKTGHREKIEGLPDGIEHVQYVAETLFLQIGTSLWVAPFDVGKRRLAGNPMILLAGVRMGGSGGYRATQSSVAGGTLAFVPATGLNHLVLVDRGGRETVLPDTLGSFHRPRFSPDGRELSLDITRASGRDVWIYNFDQRTMSRLSFLPNGHDAIWLPDGERLAYQAALQDTSLGIFAQRNDGSVVAETLFARPGTDGAEAVTPDGRLLAYATAGDTRDAWLVTPRDTARQILLGGPFNEGDLALSRDGKWLAWSSDETGTEEIYLRALAGGPRVQVSTTGGSEAVWGREAGELFYRAKDIGGPLIAVRLSLNPPRVISRDTLFEAGQYEEADPHANYDYDPVTNRFIFIRPEMPNEIRVIRDWRALLESK